MRWRYDEMRQVGVDFESASQVAECDAQPEYAKYLCRRPCPALAATDWGTMSRNPTGGGS